MASLFRISLLVTVVCAIIAHARIIIPKEQDAVTSLLTLGDAQGGSYSHKKDNNDNNNSNKVHNQRLLSSRLNRFRLEEFSVAVRTPSSVVQDWSLVCTQLCGAGLGGASCASHCATIDVPADVQEANANKILSSKKNLICQDLCRLQLGNGTCKCDIITDVATTITITTEPFASNKACSTICDHNNATLAGCSLCKNKRSLILTAVETAAAATVPHLAAVETSTAATVATTPNWTVVCASLCKTGDGGSLCNCDLSPFF